MNSDFRSEVGAALHGVADPLTAPALDLAGIQRGGRRRRLRAAAFSTLAVVAVAAGVTTGVLRLTAAPPPASVDQPPRPVSSVSSRPPGLPPQLAATTASVRAFYRGYEAARRQGDAAVQALIRAHVASWYAPLLEAPDQGGDPVECGHSGAPARLAFRPIGAAGGQLVMAVNTSPVVAANQELSVVSASLTSGKITGITCVVTGYDVTPAGAKAAVRSLYRSYTAARRRGTPAAAALEQLVRSGPESGSGYLHQLLPASVTESLGYDPILCTRSSTPNVTIGSAVSAADNSVGLVSVTPGHASPILVIIVQGARGWSVGDIACPGPGS